MLWVTVGIGVVVPLIGFVFNSLITNKINDQRDEIHELKKDLETLKDGMTTRAKEGFSTVFKRFDEYKEYIEKTFVRSREYDLSREYQEKQTDQKIVSMFSTLNTQIQGIDNRIENLNRNTNEKIDDIKAMIKELKVDGKKGE